MVEVAPFRALRYDPAVAGPPGRTSAPAYEDVQPLLYAGHRAANPYTVLELLSPSHDFGAAATAYERWVRTGVLVIDEEPALYLYEEHELRHGTPAVQRGILAAVRLPAGADTGRVLAHEDVDPRRLDGRLRRLAAVPVEIAPVFALYRDAPSAIGDLLQGGLRGSPVAALTDERGVDHRVWAVRGSAAVEAVTAALAGHDLLIADGHHRFASAAAFRELRLRDAGPAEDAPWQHTLMYLVDAASGGPELLAVHRLVQPVPADLVDRLSDSFAVEPVKGGAAGLDARLAGCAGPAIGLLRMDRAWLLRPRRAALARLPRERPDAWRELDVVVLHHLVDPLLPAARSVRYSSDLDELVPSLAREPGAAVFVVRPVPLPVVFDLAAAGVRLPPKSTWFRPKPRAGLIMRALGGPPPGVASQGPTGR